MNTIIFVAVIYFCVDGKCGMISDRVPFENKDECLAELDRREKDLKSKGVNGAIEGRCLPVEFNKQI